MSRHFKNTALNIISAITIALVFTAPSSAINSFPINPENSSGFAIKPLITGAKNMVVSANPLATEAGAFIIQQKGNAVDALIATQLVLGLTEPQASGLGGGAFAVMYHQQSKTISAWDGRETAPKNTTDAIFKKTDGSTAGFYDMVPTGKSVGVPGMIKMLWQLHQKHGKLPWGKLFTPAIKLASQGFAISPRLARMIALESHFSDAAKSYFYDEQGLPKKVGTILKNNDYAHTLKLLAKQGITPFYDKTAKNSIAADIITTLKKHDGLMEADDLASYSIKNRAVKCQKYRQYHVCGSDFPSGATSVLEALALLSHFDISVFNPNIENSTETLDLKIPTAAIDLFSAATKIAYADRNKYAADPDFAIVPKQLLDTEYINNRQKEIKNNNPNIATAGIFSNASGTDNTLEIPGTSHISIVDTWGNAISMTSSIEDKFGSRLFVRGFLLNNTLADFSFTSKDREGVLINNRIEGGKRPRSAMSPVLIFKNNNDGGIGELYGVVGAPGGSLIINYVTQTLIALLDWHLTPQQALHLPHFGSRNDGLTHAAIELEDWSKFSSNDDDNLTQKIIQTQQEHLKTVKEELEDKNYVVLFIEQPSGLSVIVKDTKTNQWQGVADPRREGSAIGY